MIIQLINSLVQELFRAIMETLVIQVFIIVLMIYGSLKRNGCRTVFPNSKNCTRLLKWIINKNILKLPQLLIINKNKIKNSICLHYSFLGSPSFHLANYTRWNNVYENNMTIQNIYFKRNMKLFWRKKVIHILMYSTLIFNAAISSNHKSCRLH